MKLKIIEAVSKVNEAQKLRVLQKITRRFGEDLSGKRFAVWGLAFKPNTDDMREAPSRVLLKELVERGATVAVHDPVAMAEAKRVLALDLGEEKLTRIEFKNGPMDTLGGAE